MYCKCGVIEMAIKICDMMEKNNVKMNEGAFNNLMQCHIMCRYVSLTVILPVRKRNGFLCDRIAKN